MIGRFRSDLDRYRCERLPANLLQAQRDYFGAERCFSFVEICAVHRGASSHRVSTHMQAENLDRSMYRRASRRLHSSAASLIQWWWCKLGHTHAKHLKWHDRALVHTFERLDKPKGQFFHCNWTGRATRFFFFHCNWTGRATRLSNPTHVSRV